MLLWLVMDCRKIIIRRIHFVYVFETFFEVSVGGHSACLKLPYSNESPSAESTNVLKEQRTNDPSGFAPAILFKIFRKETLWDLQFRNLQGSPFVSIRVEGASPVSKQPTSTENIKRYETWPLKAERGVYSTNHVCVAQSPQGGLQTVWYLSYSN